MWSVVLTRTEALVCSSDLLCLLFLALQYTSKPKLWCCRELRGSHAVNLLLTELEKHDGISILVRYHAVSSTCSGCWHTLTCCALQTQFPKHR